MHSIIKEFENRVHENPNKLLFGFLDINGNLKESYSYIEFSERTTCLASFINSNHKVKAGQRVLLAYPPGLELICAFFSCVRLGLIPVPVYPPSAQGFESSIQKMEFIAKDCQASAILTERSYYWSFQVNLARCKSKPMFSKIDHITNIEWICCDDLNETEVKEFKEAHSEILFLQYTSGSTNDPKGVIVTHENIIYNCNSVVDHLPIGVSWLPQYHDMGLIGYYIFFALKGGTTYGFSSTDFIIRPALWLETITKYSATASSAPNFAYEYCLEKGRISDETLEKLDLSSLRFLMTAAEPINSQVYNNFISKFEPYGLDPKSYFAAYGLAEFTLAVTNYGRSDLTLNSKLLKEHVVEISNTIESNSAVTNVMSCGKALGDTKIRIVDANSFIDITDNKKVGEIWVTGKSKGKGYWDRPELTKDTFEAKTLNDTTTSWLRTGDLGFIVNDELYISGRIKDMIIIRGLNYYPQDIEQIIEQDPFVRKGCTASFEVYEEGVESLIIVIGLKNIKNIPNAQKINSKLIKYLGIGASKFVYVPARTISRTSSGKIMRSLNKNRFITNDLQIIKEVDLKTNERSSCSMDIEATYKVDHLHLLFNRYGLNGSENNALGDSGLDSIKIAEFAYDLKEYLNKLNYSGLSEEVELRLLQKIAVSELFEILKELKSATHLSLFKFRSAFTKLNKERSIIEAELMKKDASIILSEKEKYSMENKNDSLGAILVTGGTGFFGPFIIKSLLEQNSDDIYVIIRANDPNEAENRLRIALDQIEPSDKLKKEFNKRVKSLCGDLSRQNLGLKIEEWNNLKNSIHTIYHNGALVNYLLDYESLRKTNINGTVEVIKLARSGRPKILNHISTTFIFGWSAKDTLFETDFNKEMENLDFGYSQSKWSSEQIVKNAMHKGLQGRIFRPALISPSILGKGYNFDISIRLLAFMVKHGIGTSAKNQVSFTPADIAANNIVAISNIKESLGLTFHVTRDTYSSMQDVTNIIRNLIRKPFHNYALKEFVPEVVSRCTKEDLLFPLLNFLVKSESKISAMEFKRYDNTNYTTFRDRSEHGMKDPSLEDVVNGICLFMKDQGIIEYKLKKEEHV